MLFHSYNIKVKPKDNSLFEIKLYRSHLINIIFMINVIHITMNLICLKEEQWTDRYKILKREKKLI